MVRFMALTAAFLLTFVTTAHAFLGFGGKYERVRAEDGIVSVSATDASTGKATFYRYEAKGGEVRFFLVKSPDGRLRAALDACDVCYHAGKGYEQKGDRMRCVNCGMEFHANRIGDVKGGCNPHPLPFAAEGDTVRIAAADLEAGTRYFPAGR